MYITVLVSLLGLGVLLLSYYIILTFFLSHVSKEKGLSPPLQSLQLNPMLWQNNLLVLSLLNLSCLVGLKAYNSKFQIFKRERKKERKKENE